MATVYLCVDGELRRHVAVKVLAENLAGDALLRRRFLREARLAARLCHPNVVAVYDVGEWLDRPYIVMEHVNGSTAAAELERLGRLPVARAIEIVLQVCAGLEHAHTAGIVHRDVKPANVLLRDDGLVKIADFGIAKATGGTGLTGAGTVLGTAAYLAPEQARGAATTARTDLYAVGVLLYELLSGTTPYAAETLPELITLQSEGKTVGLRERRPEVPAAVERIVARCLSPSPGARPASAASLGRELAGPPLSPAPLSATPPTVVLPPGLRPRLPRLPRWRPPDPRNLPRPIGIAIGAGLLAVTATSFALAWPGSDAPSSKREPAGPEPAPPAAEPAAPAVSEIPRAADPVEFARNLSAWLRSQPR
jgi:serine/threonine-protein kinase